ncbi:MAG: XdhC family protein, partial [candidate division KSB1 bacterium]|nr:XdhC family protein [candidate division KSB1 bacterium]
MGDLVERIAQLKKQGRTFCIVTVVDSAGATPRKAGAKGLVFPDGSIEGTVGGGNIELQAIQTARRVLQSKQPLLQKFELENLEVGGM